MLKKPGESLSVLIVEDERRLRAPLLLETIPELGFSASAASSGEEALSMLEREPCDILLLDLNLPGMGGMELFERVRERSLAAQVVILSAFGDLESARRAIHLDAVEFLSKPFHLGDIEKAFERALRRIVGEFPQAQSEMGAEISSEASAVTLAESEHRQILAALQRHCGNRTAAAGELGISRRTLHYRLAEYRERGWNVE